MLVLLIHEVEAHCCLLISCCPRVSLLNLQDDIDPQQLWMLSTNMFCTQLGRTLCWSIAFCPFKSSRQNVGRCADTSSGLKDLSRVASTVTFHPLTSGKAKEK